MVGLIAADEVNGIIEESEVRGFARAVYFHDEFRPNLMNHDLALIELETSLQFNSHLQPVCLPAEMPPPGRECFIAGWGMASLDSLSVQTHLMEAKITILADAICEKIFAPFGLWNSETTMCAMGKEGEGSCHGDAGGPVICVDDK